MEQKTYLVECSECDQTYQQTGFYEPNCCGACGLRHITVWLKVKDKAGQRDGHE